jgi:hypothetical protein
MVLKHAIIPPYLPLDDTILLLTVSAGYAAMIPINIEA